MDEPKIPSDVSDESTNSGQVMDIKVSTPATGVTDVASASTSSTDVVTPSPEPTETTAFEAPAEAPVEPVAAPTPESSAHQDNPMAIPPQTPKKRGAPVLAITIAVIVCLALAGLAVFTYLKSNKAKKSTNTSATTQKATTAKATSSDVDSTSKQLDQNLSKVDETKDFPDNDLSDTALNL